MKSEEIRKELCIVMSKVWEATGIKDTYEPCDCICDTKGHKEEYIRVDDGVIEFIKKAVDDKIADMESEAQATLYRIKNARATTEEKKCK